MDRISIKDNSENLIDDAGVSGKYPVQLEKIVKHLGYETCWFMPNQDSKNISGAVDYHRKRIYINQNEVIGRQQFTLAHEIGHIALYGDDDREHIDYRAEELKPKDESEMAADYFAANLLMPEKIFKQKWNEWKDKITLERIAKLCAFFGTSLAAVTVRAESLNCE